MREEFFICLGNVQSLQTWQLAVKRLIQAFTEFRTLITYSSWRASSVHQPDFFMARRANWITWRGCMSIDHPSVRSCKLWNTQYKASLLSQQWGHGPVQLTTLWRHCHRAQKTSKKSKGQPHCRDKSLLNKWRESLSNFGCLL